MSRITVHTPRYVAPAKPSQLALLRVANVVFLLLTLFFNYVANVVPLGGKTTGELSAQYPNLFTPANLTFSIWGVIYLALFLFIIWQAAPMRSNQVAHQRNTAITALAWDFVGLCVLNMLWLYCWHFEHVTASVVVMLVTLGLLIRINRTIFLYLPHTTDNRNFLQIPFGLYLGWISVATVANITAWLVGMDWNGWGLSPTFWTIGMMIVATLLALAAISWWDNVPYALAVAWALAGIAIKHQQMSEAPLSMIIVTAYVGILLLLISMLRNAGPWWQSAVSPAAYVERRVHY